MSKLRARKTAWSNRDRMGHGTSQSILRTPFQVQFTSLFHMSQWWKDQSLPIRGQMVDFSGTHATFYSLNNRRSLKVEAKNQWIQLGVLRRKDRWKNIAEMFRMACHKVRIPLPSLDRGAAPENLDQSWQLWNWMKRAATLQYLCGRNFILYFWFLFF